MYVFSRLLQREIPISRGLLEDMLISLDMNLDEELDYGEMARGMELARREKREDRRKELSREATSVSQRSGEWLLSLLFLPLLLFHQVMLSSYFIASISDSFSKCF